MRNLKRLRPSPALLVAGVALVMAMSGAAIALPGKGKVKSNDIAKGAVKSKAIAKGAIGSKQIKGKSIKGNRIKDKAIKAKQIAEATITNGKLADATITGAKVAPDGLDSSNISDYKHAATGVVSATDGVDEATARAAAPPQELFSKGPLSVYGKCYRDTTANETFAYVYAATTENGSLLDADDDLTGDPDFLNANTAEVDREIENSVDALANSAETTEGEFMAMAPDGTKIVGQLGSAVKNGDLAGGNGIYGAGNVCLFQVEVAG
jgi:hypothetical protein